MRKKFDQPECTKTIVALFWKLLPIFLTQSRPRPGPEAAAAAGSLPAERDFAMRRPAARSGTDGGQAPGGVPHTAGRHLKISI